MFNQALAVNTYGPFGHVLAVDGFYSTMCSPYATPATVAMALKAYGSKYRQCYSWLGPNQPGVNEPDPTDPSAQVPDPGGAPPGQKGPKTSAARLEDSTTPAAASSSSAASSDSSSHSSNSSSSAQNTIGQIVSKASGQSSGSGVTSSQAQQLLNYLLAP